MDTSGILEHVNLEQLTSEEIFDLKHHLGSYQVHIQLKTMVFDPKHCTVKLYRIIILPKIHSMNSRLSEGESEDITSNINISS
jgi:hypothetical protein